MSGLRRAATTRAERISPDDAASLVKSGMWLDYGAVLCQPDAFDRALARRASSLSHVRVRSCLSLSPRAFLECDPDGRHFQSFNWHFGAYDRAKGDSGRCIYVPLHIGEVPD